MQVSEWKEKTRKTITLKSGLEVTVRRLSPFALMKYGNVPGMEPVPQDKQGEVTMEILKAAMIQPKIGDGPEDISLFDLDADDLNEIMSAITGVVQRAEEGLPLAPTA